MATCIDVTDYGHPGSHPAAMITQNELLRFCTDVQIAAWTAMALHTAIVEGNPHQVTKTELVIQNVDNTSDVDKPISTLQAAAIALKTDLTVFNAHYHNFLHGEGGVVQNALRLDAAGDVFLRNGTGINEFSTDGLMAGDSDSAVPTERAVKQFVENLRDNFVPTKLTTPDGTPEVAFSADVAGRVSCVNGIGVDRFSDDPTLAGNSDFTIPTEKALVAYIAARIAANTDWRLQNPDGSIATAVSINSAGLMLFPTGVGINRFSSDGTLASDSNDFVPTERAVKTYFDTNLSAYIPWRLQTPDGNTPSAVFMDNTGRMAFPIGTGINEFSIDGTLTGNTDDAVPTEKAVKTYADAVAAAAVVYADAVAVAANLYADGVGTTAAAYADDIGTAAEAYADAVGVAANLYADGKFADGLSETLSFGGGTTGDVATLTIVNGLITAKTLVP